MTPTSEAVSGFMERARGLAIAGLLSLWLAVKPVPASRPRVSRFGTYNQKGYAHFLADAQRELNKVKADIREGYLVATVECVAPRAKTSKLELPRGDVDNYAKGVLDAVTKAAKVWVDDDRVAVLVVGKRFARAGEDEGIRLTVASI